MPFNDLLWFMMWSFWFVAYLYVVILIVTDLFRDDEAGGWMRAVWIVGLVFVPFLTGLLYLILRGKGMAERAQSARHRVVPEADDYRPAASTTPADDIAGAKRLLDAGTITHGEFDALKSKALGNQYYGV
ncbi:PLDc N-terminal domain-containing protein [Microbacterium sp. Sa4CUA7]|uniref:PLDc N-terminal domain-containing protein n=1 Tax=Microbacterium pullorum TaxID=2762236 RepID=A0ABR8S1Y7_9MICO|nr:PLDc N-terminal domain-containing protein [Microbacterium pullorum]MBD7957364.1 PLDc N-terminal domain-containing protein [Microbacterium pullorum]